MSVELESTFESVKIRERNCAPRCGEVKWVKNKGAILIIVWSFLVGSVFHLLRAGFSEKTWKQEASNTGFILMSSVLLYPIGGWLADTQLGRYAVIRYSMWIMWICSLLLTVSEVLTDVSDVYAVHSSVIFKVLYSIMAMALGGFQSNIIQLGVDQLADSSSTEITSFITWYTMMFFASAVIFHYTSDGIENIYSILYIKAFVVSVCISLALCLDYLFNYKLVKEQATGSPLKTTLKVIWYTYKSRKFKHNFTHNEDSLSSFDIAKHRYGGPFTTQQVENVRTFLWMIVVIAMFAVICGILYPLEYAQDKMMFNTINWEGCTSWSTCYQNLSVHYFGYVFVIVVFFLYEFIIRPLFANCMPRLSTVNMFLLGAVFTVFWIFSLLILESVAYQTGLYNGKCIFTEVSKLHILLDYKWFLLSKSIHGISSLLFLISSFKFIWSQAPSTMKGTLFGLGYCFLGLSTLLHTAIASLFIFDIVSWDHTKLTCGIWYYLMEGLITLVAVVLITVVVQIYKKRNTGHTAYLQDNEHTTSVNYS